MAGKGKRFILAAAVLLAGGLATAAGAEPVGGFGLAVGTDLGRQEIHLARGMVLVVSDETRLLDAAGRSLALADVVASEDAEVVVKYAGDRRRGVVHASKIEVGVEMPR
jgi:hypothetical protein